MVYIMQPHKTIRTVAINDIHFIPFVLSSPIVPIKIVKNVIERGIYEMLTLSAIIISATTPVASKNYSYQVSSLPIPPVFRL